MTKRSFAAVSNDQHKRLRNEAKQSEHKANPPILQQMRRIKELKSFDTNCAINIATSTNGIAPLLLNGCKTGSGTWNRIGKRITMTSFYLNGAFHFTASPVLAITDQPMSLRLFVVYDTRTNGANPGATDLIDTQTMAAGGSLGAGISHQGNNLANRDRFRILFEKRMVLHFHGASRVVDPPQASETLVCEYRKMKHLPVMFNADTGAVGDIVSGGLFLCAMWDNCTVLNATFFKGVCRIKFEDE